MNWKKFSSKYLINRKKIIFRLPIFVIFPIIIFIDQITKIYLYGGGNPRLDLKLIAINEIYVMNHGAAFSSLQNNTMLLQVVAFLFLAFSLVLFFIKIPTKYVIIFAFIASGAIGNVIDRFTNDGGVRDFISFPWWPKFAIFNVADASVSLSMISFIIILIIEIFIDLQKNRKNVKNKLQQEELKNVNDEQKSVE